MMEIHNFKPIENKKKNIHLMLICKIMYIYSGLSVMVVLVSAVKDYVKNKLDINRIAGYLFILLISAVCFLYVLKGLAPIKSNKNESSNSCSDKN